MLAIFLAVGSSLLYGVSDFLGGMKSRSLPLLTVLIVSQASALGLLTTLVIALGLDAPAGEVVVYGAIAGLAEAVGVAALYRGLAVATMSIVAPIAGTAPVVAVVAAIALGEAPAPTQGLGIAVAVAGVAIVSSAPAGGSSVRRVGPSVAFGSLAALGFGGFLVAIDAASEGGVVWALLFAKLTALSAFAAVVVLRRPAVAITRRDLPVLALIGSLMVGADALYATASTAGLLSAVAALSSLYPIVTIALARVYLHERLERAQQLGAGLALFGAAAISV